HQGISLEELREQLVGDAAEMGSGVTELAELADGMALGELDGPFSELAVVAGGRVVHLPSLTEDVVPTYRLGEVEAGGGRLLVGVASDLAAFAWHGELRSVDGVVVGPVDLWPAEIGWLGERAWLAGAADDVVAVRARRGGSEHAVVSLEPL